MNRLKITNQLYRYIQKILYKFSLYKLTNHLGIYQPRIVTNIDGGLGSQMWQFAIGYVIAKKSGLPLTLNVDFYVDGGKDCDGVENRHFLLFETFPTIRNLYQNSIEQSETYKNIFRDRIGRSNYVYDPNLSKPGKPIFLSQYYSNAKYILGYKKDLLELFKFDVSLTNEEKQLIAEINEHPSCAVHIRKGDFVGLGRDICSAAYYAKAIHKIQKLIPDVKFYIFSNDESYFEEQVLPLCSSCNYKNLVGRSESTPQADLYLMTQCHHSIISNSGFSWIAAYFKNEDSIVIMPDIWDHVPEKQEISRKAFHIQNWIQLPTK